MSQFTREDVDKIALLSRLSFDEGQAEQFAHQLSDILTYIDKLSELDTSEIEPTSHPMPIKNVLRADVVTPILSAEQVLSNAPEQQEQCFKVPAIIQES